MKPRVSIRCTVYNHEPYLRNCLEGFVMQKTNFPFEAVVHDDASTDNSAQIIKEYAEKYPDIIKPIFETENQYSKGKNVLAKIMDNACVGDYVAYCEGDDYWTDPYKLQKQYDFMESHHSHSLCFCAHSEESRDGSKKPIYRYDSDVEICSPKDLILLGGGFMATNSMFLRKNIYIPYYNWYENSTIGDYPTVLSLVAKGNVGYLHDNMCVYRIQSIGSWTEKVSNQDYKKTRERYLRNIKMMIAYDSWTKWKFHKYVIKIIFECFMIVIRCYSLPIRVSLGLSKMTREQFMYKKNNK